MTILKCKIKTSGINKTKVCFVNVSFAPFLITGSLDLMLQVCKIGTKTCIEKWTKPDHTKSNTLQLTRHSVYRVKLVLRTATIKLIQLSHGSPRNDVNPI